MVEKSKVLKILNEVAPLSLAEPWDNCGLLVDAVDAFSSILVCLDVTPGVLDEAETLGCNLIVSHHPPIFNKLSRLSQDDIAFMAIKRGISLYAAHTNMDKAPDGLNQQLAEMIGLQDITGFGAGETQDYAKIVVFCPVSDEHRIRKALSDIGAGHMGNYKDCAFTTDGIGSFYPLNNANPAVGTVGRLENVPEIRIETLIQKENISAALEKIKEAHSYEEPVIDVYQLINPVQNTALGRMGRFSSKITVEELVLTLKEAIQPAVIKVAGDMDRLVEKAAVSCGAGGDMLYDALSTDADVLITGEVKHHQYLEAVKAGLVIIEAGHYDTEKQFVKTLHRRLQGALNGLKSNVTVFMSKTEQCPYIAVL